MQPKICETHILEDTLPGGTLSESIEHIPVSFLSRIDFKYVYPHVLYFSRNNAIRIFHVFVFCNFAAVCRFISAHRFPAYAA